MARRIAFILLLTWSTQAVCQKPDEIEIIRDKWGVPHIYAPTDAQVAYGLAWAHAEDNFKTIQLTILGAKQMLGRHLGKEGAVVDYVVGLLRCEEIVNNQMHTVSPEFLKLVEGYVAGLNAYARHHPKELYIKKVFPITAKDVFKAYVLQLAVMDGADKLIKKLVDSDVPNVLPSTIGSNAIAVAPHKTEDHATYLAVNSHQPLEGPAAWYEAHLVSDEGWNALGGLFPGGPVIFHGTNEHLGWAHTVNYPDKIDVFELEMHPDIKNSYKMDNEWLRLEEKKVKLKVKLPLGIQIGLSKKAYHSVYGPVVKNDDGVFAFSMSVFQEIRAIEQWYEMNKATDLKSFKDIMSEIRIPSFNTVYGDKRGDIFYVSNALLPKRNPDYDWNTTVPGNTTKTRFDSFQPFDQLPQLTNPPSGYVFNTNNSPFHATGEGENITVASIDKTMGFKPRENNRSIRMKELMAQYGKLADPITWEKFIKIKYDAQLPDSTVYGININPLLSGLVVTNKKASAILKIIQKWDKVALADRKGPAQLLLTYDHLSKNIPPSSYSNPTALAFENALIYAYDYLIKHFDRIDLALGEYQKLVRGKKELPLSGIPDVITAMYGEPHTDGKTKGKTGESYIMMIRYPKTGLPEIQTINVYGASENPTSPHFDDQMELFVQQKLKPMTLDIDEVRKEAKSIYHPK